MTRELTANCKYCGQSIFVEVTDTEISLAKAEKEYIGMSDSEIASVLSRIKAIQKCNCEGSNDHKKQLIRRNFEGFVGGGFAQLLRTT